MNKKEAYAQLVQAVQEDYRQRTHEDDEKKGRPYVAACAYEGKQINLWSYWRGNLDADILVLGQDWGSFIPDPNDKKRKLDCMMLENFKRMDDGEKVGYFDGVTVNIMSPTDRNLITLFKELGMDIGSGPDENQPLFFSNLCLGYRNKGYSGGFKRKWITDDVKYLVGYDENGEHVHGLLEIIKPEIVICLGKEVYGAVTKALGVKVPLVQFYNFLDAGKNYTDFCFSDKSIRIFGMAHPGSMGQANRVSKCKIEGNTLDGMKLQKKDWKNIFIYYESSRV